MKYIYDIVLNFNKRIYEFYEWMDSDNIEYIKKIPIFKVNKKVFNDIKNNNIKISSEFLNNIYNKCEIYDNYGIKKIDYAVLFSIDDDIIAIKFNKNNESILISDLYIDEKIDILNYVKRLNITNIDYKIISKYKTYLITRKEIDMIEFIKNEINLIYKNNNIDKIRYIYYECFNKLENDLLIINNDLEKYIKNNPEKIYNLLKLKYKEGLQN